MLQQEFPDGADGDLQGLCLGITVDAGGDQRERDGLAALALGQLERANIATSQQRRLILPAAPPDGADCVNHIPGRQMKAVSNHSLSHITVTNGPAGPVQLIIACGGEDGTAHPAAGRQGAVGSVDNGVHGHFRDVAAHNLKRHEEASSRMHVPVLLL